MREVLFLMMIPWQGQVHITKVLLTYSFCLVSSIKHIPNFSSFLCQQISTYSSQPDWLHQAALKEYLQLIFVPVLLKSFYRSEGLKEPRSFNVDFSKISCLKKIRKITFKKTTTELKTKQHVRESREKRHFKSSSAHWRPYFSVKPIRWDKPGWHQQVNQNIRFIGKKERKKNVHQSDLKEIFLAL